jgi:hypothetical protein
MGIILVLIGVAYVYSGLSELRKVGLLSATVEGRYTSDIECKSTKPSLSSPDKKQSLGCRQAITFRLPGDNADRTIRRMLPLTVLTNGFFYETFSYALGKSVILHYDKNLPDDSVVVKDDLIVSGVVSVLVGSLMIWSTVMYVLLRRN